MRDCLHDIYNVKETEKEAKDKLDYLFTSMENYLESRPNTVIVLNNLYLNPYRTETHLDANSEYSFSDIEISLNRKIKEFAKDSPSFIILDWKRAVSFYGYKSLYDIKYWYLGRIKYTKLGFEILNKEFESLLKAYTGKIKKVLVLDLDNVLWGGIIGEDGLDGIKLSEDGIGKAYRDFQKLIKQMKDIGILLTICSKNNLEDVKEVFENHPMMVLNFDDFVSKKINWKNKVTNIKEIADELNLGLDSFVFIDDNPTEREVVRRYLEMVAVPDFPSNPEDLPQWFINDVVFEYFPKISVTKEDMEKTRQYIANIKRKNMSKKLDINEFLRTLEIRIKIYNDDTRFLVRTAQMTQKTNQFNLTTKRYTENDIRNFINNPDWHIFNLEYEDKFGNEGIVGTSIVKVDGKNAYIDSFLMSCRIIGKNVEYVFLYEILKKLRELGVNNVYAQYIKTRKNSLVKNFYDECGLKNVKVINETVFYEGEIDNIIKRLEGKQNIIADIKIGGP